MVGTAFYALGVIACIILIVLAAAFAIVSFTRLLPLLFGAALLALIWWIASWQLLLWASLLGAIIGGLLWIAIKRERKQNQAATKSQDRRWSALDKSWSGDAVAGHSQEPALDWWQRTAEDGNPNSQWRLGWLYERGEGVPQDYVQAYKWYALATHNLSPNSRQYDKTLRDWSEDSNRLTAKITPQQIIEAQRMASEWLQHRSDAVNTMAT
jgi:hypothetical protein